MSATRRPRITANHWGTGLVSLRDGRIEAIDPHPTDPDPSPINGNLAASLNGRARVLRPSIRAGWLKGEGGGERGRDPFVEVGWDEALDIVAAELRRVIDRHGNEAIFAGSYGWASAGRFHHAQGQLKRFLNTLGGFVGSVGNYSYQAALVAMPHIVGGNFRQHLAEATRWPVVAENADLVVMFGGLALRNCQISDGGLARHRMAQHLARCAEGGVRFVNISPLRSDADPRLGAEWLAPRPGTDTAVMLGLAHTLLAEGLLDRRFLDRYTVGFERFSAYLTGRSDGVEKSADWAGDISGLDPDRLRRLAREMAAGRTLITTAAGLQRADWGEAVLWMTVTLAAMLGQIGLPGGGYGIGYAVNGNVGNMVRPFPFGAFPQGTNPVQTAIPVALLSDMLLNPGGQFRFDGRKLTFPDIRLVWWAGGNPFHHHQDLNRLRRAFQRPQTVIVNEINWTATARHADIVLPVAAATERCDFAGGRSDNALVPMPALVAPPGSARTEFQIFADLAERLGTRHAFDEGLDADGWLRRMWQDTRASARQAGTELPDWETFIAGDVIELPDPAPERVFLAEFRADPDARPRPTPSGKIEIFSQTVAGFGLDAFPGHASWKPPRDWSGPNHAAYPLALISGQPATRLHSQLDNGAFSMAHKIAGREPVLINPADAARRGIAEGDVVELFNDRGRCLAGAHLSDEVMPGVVFLWTGAWFDPDFAAPQDRDRHGNPNVLTHDLRTSEFAQGPAAHSAMVEVARFQGDPPPVRAHEPPEFVPYPGFDRGGG